MSVINDSGLRNESAENSGVHSNHVEGRLCRISRHHNMTCINFLSLSRGSRMGNQTGGYRFVSGFVIYVRTEHLLVTTAMRGFPDKHLQWLTKHIARRYVDNLRETPLALLSIILDRYWMCKTPQSDATIRPRLSLCFVCDRRDLRENRRLLLGKF